jgi:DNA-binding CsgD family transcriptional regulator/tetratricopeptide (TPR) repeat protein
MSRTDRPQTVGRAEELTTLDRLLTPTGVSCRAVLISGPGGIGKTHLLRRLEGHARSRGHLVLSGGCAWAPGVLSEVPPYGPVREAIGRETRPGFPGPGLKAWLEPWRQSDDDLAEKWLDPVLRHQEQFVQGLLELDVARPVLLCVDDLHWADRSSLALLLHVARSAPTQSVLIAATTRDPTPDDIKLTGVLDQFRRMPDVEWLELESLPDADARELVVRAGLDRELDAERIDSIVKRARGNPLAATELARATTTAAVPPSISASVALRLSVAPSVVQRAVKATSVLGVTFERQTAMDLLRRETEETGDDSRGLDQAIGCGLLEARDVSYSFFHGLEQEAVYALLTPEEKSHWHRRAAEVLELAEQGGMGTDLLGATSGPLPPSSGSDAQRRGAPSNSPDLGVWSVIASHWDRAGDRQNTCRTSLIAARRAAGVRAFPEASAHQLRALETWPPGDAQEDRAADNADEALIAAAELTRWASEPERGLALLERRSSQHPTALIWERVGWFRREIGDEPGAVVAYANASALLDDADDPQVRARVLAGQAAMSMTHLRFGESVQFAEEGLKLLDDARSSLRAHLLTTLGVGLAWSGETERGLLLLEEARDVALAIGDEAALWRYTGNVTFVLQNLNRVEEAVEISLAAYSRAKRLGLQRSLAVLPSAQNAVYGLNLLGRWEESQRLADELLSGDPPAGQRALVLSYLADAQWWSGQDEEADVSLRRALSNGVETMDPWLAADLDVLAARLATTRRDLAGARRAVDAALARPLGEEDPDGRLWLIIAALRVEASFQSRSRQDRVATLELTLGSITDTGAAIAGTAELCRAELARVRSEDRPEQWRAIATVFTDARQPHLAAECQIRRAEAALRLRDRRSAGRAVAEAHGLLSSLGRCRLRAELADLVRRARLEASVPTERPLQEAGRRPARAAAAGLTAREVDVLRLLIEGFSNRQVSRSLGISERTASVHVSNLMAKLDVGSRMEAAAAARRQGLLD